MNRPIARARAFFGRFGLRLPVLPPPALSIALCLFGASALADERTVGLQDRIALSLTVYENGLSLV